MRRRVFTDGGKWKRTRKFSEWELEAVSQIRGYKPRTIVYVATGNNPLFFSLIS